MSSQTGELRQRERAGKLSELLIACAESHRVQAPLVSISSTLLLAPVLQIDLFSNVMGWKIHSLWKNNSTGLKLLSFPLSAILK